MTFDEIVDGFRNSAFKSAFVFFEQGDRFVRYLDREDLDGGIDILAKITSLTFRWRKFGEANSERNYAADAGFVNTEAVSEELGAEMPPAVSEEFVELLRRDAVGEKLFVDETEVRVKHAGLGTSLDC